MNNGERPVEKPMTPPHSKRTSDTSKAFQVPSLAVSLLLTFGAAALGSFATSSSVALWYPTLQKPSWNPPPWIFAPVWTLLYLGMAIAAWLVWKKREISGGVRPALISYFVQLALNSSWSLVFFGLRRPDWALVDICLLWIAIATCTVLFFRIGRSAGILMIPYLAWVSFAAVLNYFIWSMN